MDGGKEGKYVYVQDWELLLKCHLHLQSIDEAFRITETASSCQICNRKLRFKSVINFHIFIY